MGTVAKLRPIIEILEGDLFGWINGYEYYCVYYNEFTKNHINDIEWSFAKRRLAKFNGLSYEKFHIQECKFLWNYKDSNLYKVLRESPLNYVI